MSSPDISPMLARLTGGDYKRALKARLEELADETDDAAYASRLRLVARGERPLRTLELGLRPSSQPSQRLRR